jgi:hypothetical protein
MPGGSPSSPSMAPCRSLIARGTAMARATRSSHSSSSLTAGRGWQRGGGEGGG